MSSDKEQKFKQMLIDAGLYDEQKKSQQEIEEELKWLEETFERVYKEIQAEYNKIHPNSTSYDEDPKRHMFILF